MSLKIVITCLLFTLGCSSTEEFIDYKYEPQKVIGQSCVSDFSDCEPYADLILGDGPDQPVGLWVISAYFPGDDTGLSFFLKGAPKDIEGTLRLNDTRTERATYPYAVREIRKSKNKSLFWLSTGDSVDVSFPFPDFVKIVYDINTIDRDSGEEMRYKGELVAPILARCYNDTGAGTGTGILDPYFSSPFCSQYKKHNHF